MNNEEIAKHTGVPVERVNQIEAEVKSQLAELRANNPDFDKISASVAPCPVFVEAADHERLKQERDGLAAQLASAKKNRDEYRLESVQLADYIRSLGQLLGCANGDDTPTHRVIALKEELASVKEENARLSISNDALTSAFEQAFAERNSATEQLATVTRSRDDARKEWKKFHAWYEDLILAATDQPPQEAFESQAALNIRSLRSQLLKCQEGLTNARILAQIALGLTIDFRVDEAAAAIEIALSTSPATALAEALESAFENGAMDASDTRKKLL